jgi:uncharacterized damage-inducible protein DinB
MNNLSNTVAEGFVFYYQDFARQVGSLAEQLSEEQFWVKPYSYGNSFGNLVLHVTGNLSYYIGARIANTGYVRERELEFTTSHLGRKSEVLGQLNEIVDIVIETLRSQTSETWAEEYRAVGVDDVEDRFSIYLRCVVHFHHHIGQMIYLLKELTKEDVEPGSK